MPDCLAGRCRYVYCLLVWLLAAATALESWAEDWPAYRRDAARSAVSGETLSFPLHRQWTYRPKQRPRPAWSEPGRAYNIMDFDYAFQPVVAGGLVYFGSSGDDTVRALDAQSGDVVWSFVTGGPIRLAPQFDSGRLYVASDDGLIYCLDAASGEMLWSFRGGLDDRYFIAQGRLTSRWPARSGVLVREGVVYVTMGMWPSEGVFLYALDAVTGRQIWCNDTDYADYIPYPHEPSVAFGGPAPQGYLLAQGDILVVPTGRSAPAGYDTRTGRQLYYDAGAANRGGTHLLLGDDRIFTATVAWQPDQSVRLGESPAHRADSLAAIHIETGREEWPYTRPIKALTDETQGPRWRSEIGAGIFGRQRGIFHDGRLYTMGNGKVDAIDLEEGEARRIWSLDRPRVYSEALTASALLLGLEGQIEALHPETGDQLWQTAVEGQIRGLAVADGRIIASNERGEIFCFAEPEVQPRLVEKTEGSVPAGPIVWLDPQPDADRIVHEVPASALHGGFGLVIGEPNARLAEALARQTGLHIVAVLDDPAEVQAERQRLVAETSLYGRQVSVLPISSTGPDRQLPLIPYFANLVVVSGDADGVPANELYRVLRPCGGAMTFVQGANPLRALAGADIPPDEFQDPLLLRGKLEGAFDWDSEHEVDHRVRWPLEFQWFGDPGPQLVKPRHARPPTPIAAGGRMFVFGEYHVTAVDAYNGTQLWRRRLNPATVDDKGGAFADDDYLYLRQGRTVASYEAATGKLASVYRPTSGPPVHEASEPLTFETAVRQGHSGIITIDAGGHNLEITLTTRSPEPSIDDAWELAFDFRPPQKRLEAPGSGTFELIVEPWSATLRKHETFDHPAVQIERIADDVLEEGGRESVVRLSIPWHAIRQQTGWRPSSFALAADMKLWQKDFRAGIWDRPLVQDRYFFNQAEAIFLRDPDKGEAAIEDGILSRQLPVPVVETLPLHAESAGRQPLMVKLDGNKDMRDASGNPWHSTPRASGFEMIRRQSPLTLESGWRDYIRSYGCSGFSCSATMDFFRSGTIGVYDRADDSGMRNISGIRSGCGLTLLPAQGMLLYSESAADCLCGYSFATSLAMAPVEHRRNEDWALFHQQQMTPAQIRQSAVNFGAPGDRRDDDGILWLGFPRPRLAVEGGYTLELPYRAEHLPGFGPRRVNGDRQSFGSSRDWIYASQSLGLTEIQMDMVYYHPQQLLVSLDEAEPPVIDGDLSDSCWNGFGAVAALNGEGSYYFRHDAEHLYVAYEQQSQRDRRGRATPWKAAVTDRDGPVDRDDHIRFSFHNRGGTRIVTMAATAAGGVYDSVLDFATDIPPVPAGTMDDPNSAARIELPDEGELQAGWNEQGLVLRLHLPQDLNGGDGITLGGVTLLLAANETSPMQQLTIETSTGTLRTQGWDGEEATAGQIEATTTGEDQRIIEALVPWKSIGLRGHPDETVRLALRWFDSEDKFFDPSRTAPFGSARERTSELSRARGLTLRLSEEKKDSAVRTERRRNHYGYLAYDLVPLADDRPEWDGEWTARVAVDEDYFRAELAIPWSTLEEAGLSRDRLQLNLHKLPHASGAMDRMLPLLERQSIMVHTLDQPSPAKYTVRLHFAELEDVEPGQRLFDVELQGKVVLPDLDVVRAAGGRFRPLVREFTDISADQILHLKLIPKGDPLDERSVPILSGMEVLEQ